MKNKRFYFGIFILIFIFSFCICLNLKNKSFKLKINETYARKIIDDSYVKMYPNDTVFDVGNYLQLENYVVKDKNGNIKNDSSLLSTNDILVYNSKEYVIAVVGDVSADGKIKYTDVLKLYRYYADHITITPAEEIAADVNGDGKIKYTDILKLYRYHIGEIDTLYDGDIFVIKFVNTFNNSTSTKSVEAGKNLGTLPSLTQEGYEFKGWYTEQSGGTKVESDRIPIQDETYYSRWQIKQYTISFNGNGADNPASIERDYNTEIGELPTISKEGYTFDGWYTAQSGGTKISSSTKVIENKTYYAHWIGEKYTVTFDGNGVNNPASVERDYNADLGSLPELSRTGYTFDGWYTEKTGGAVVTPTTKITSNKTFYAHWTIETYTVTFNGNGADNPASIERDYNTEIGELPTISKEGYTFDGWYTEQSGGTKISSSTKITGNKTFYAHWIGEKYTVTFDGNSGNSPASVERDYNAEIGELPTISRLGYTFDGWYTEKTGGVVVTPTTKITSNKTFYAHWTIETYTVTFDGNGADNPASIEREYNTEIGELPAISRLGYTFDGWYTAQSGGTKISSTKKITGNKTFYAHWIVNTYTISFDGNEGTDPDSITRDYDTEIGTLPNSIRKYTITYKTNGQGVSLDKSNDILNYNLDGWYTEKTGGSKILSTTKVPASNTTYYAHWSTSGMTLATVTKPDFLCTWNTKSDGTGTSYTSKQANYITDKDVTLYAMCERIYIATFDGNGGTNGKSIYRIANAELGTLPTSTKSHTITYNENSQGATISATSSKVNYEFKGWYTEQSGGSKISSSTKMPTDNVTYYAHWGENSGTLASVIKDGYVCKWNTKADKTGTSYISNQTDFTTDKDITLYADCDIYFIATFDGNGGKNGYPIVQKPNQKLGELPTSSRIHTITYDVNGSGATIGSTTGSVSHTFDGWYTEKTAGEQITSNTLMATHDIKYYAHWTPGTTTLTSISRKGHTCTWNTQKDGKGTDYSSSSTGYSTSSDVTLYGKCTPNTYTVSYDANGGSGAPKAQPYVYSDTGVIYLSSTKPTKTGYSLKEWKVGNTTYQSGGQYNRNNDVDVTLVAQYSPITYSVKFNANGGEGTMSNQLMTYDKSANLTTSSFTIAGGTFKNWNTKADGTGTTYTNGQSVKNLTSTSGAVINLYAIYEYQDEIHFIKAGSSDAILVQSNGKFGLIDASNPNKSDSHGFGASDSYGNGITIKNYLDKIGVKHLDFIIASHHHSDHIGGLPDLVNNSTFVDSNTVFIYKDNFANVYPNEYPGEVTEGYYQKWWNNEYLNNAKTSLSNKGALMLNTISHSGNGMTKLGASYVNNADAYKQYITYNFGNYNFKIYNLNLYTFYSDAHEATSTYDGPEYLTTDENDNSLVALITTNKNKKVLLTGDLNVKARFEQWYGELIGHVDVLKANHHGYHYSNSKGLIDATTPTYFIVPNTESVETSLVGTKTSTISGLSSSSSDFGAARLYMKNIGTKVYKTGDMTDACVIKFNGSNITVNNANGRTLSSASEMNSNIPNGWHIWFDNDEEPVWTLIKNNNFSKDMFDHNNTTIPGTSNLAYYWFDKNGLSDGTTKYYFHGTGNTQWFGDEDGDWYAKSEWLTLNGSTYYFKSDGHLAISEYVADANVDNKYYYVDSSGCYYSDEYYYWVQDSTGWYFRGSNEDKDGKYWYAKSEDIWIYKNGTETKYTMDSSGYAQ